jgi:putative effector of murein hydrolase
MDLFWTVAVVLVVLWLFGIIEIGGELINLLIVIAIVVVAYRLYQGRNPVSGR